MFRRASLVVMNKMDLLDRTGFDLAAAIAATREVHPGVAILTASCRSGEGVEEAAAWLESRITAKLLGSRVETGARG